MKKLLYFVVLIVLIHACRKNTPDDLSGDLYIRGRVFIRDDIFGNTDPQPLPNVTVKLAYHKDVDSNYLVSASADKDGYFVFTGLRKDSSFYVFVDTSLDSIKFNAERNIPGLTASQDSVNVVMMPDTLQHGIVYTVEDSTGTGVVGGVNICIFNSPVIAALDTCAGSNYSLISDPLGNAAAGGLVPGTYYTRAKFQVGNTIFTAKDVFTIGDTLVRRTLLLHQ